MAHRFKLIQKPVVVLVALMFLCPALEAQLAEFSDAEIEDCLQNGEVGKKAGRLVGVTRPEHLKIDCSVALKSVVFKSLDEQRKGVTRLPGGATEFNFSDSYKYERAAYLLDRELGMNMVPVAIIRSIKGDEGALVAWIPNASTGNQMKKQPTGAQMAYLTQQKATMRLFDALILNVDRRPDNWMIDNDTWQLYLIDHSRAFRDRKELPEEFTSRPTRLERDLYDRLRALDSARLNELLADLLTGTQIDGLLDRRDQIVAKIEQDREQYGDSLVFAE